MAPFLALIFPALASDCDIRKEALLRESWSIEIAGEVTRLEILPETGTLLIGLYQPRQSFRFSYELWDPTTGSVLRQEPSQSGLSSHYNYSGKQRKLLYSDLILQYLSANQVTTIRQQIDTGTIVDSRFSDDGQILCVVSVEERLICYDIENLPGVNVLWERDMPIGAPLGIYTDAKTGLVSALTVNGVLCRFEITSGDLLDCFQLTDRSAAAEARFLGPSQVAIQLTPGEEIAIWELPAKPGRPARIRTELEPPSPAMVTDMAVSPDNRWLAAKTKTGEIGIYDLRNEENRLTQSFPEVYKMALSNVPAIFMASRAGPVIRQDLAVSD